MSTKQVRFDNTLNLKDPAHDYLTDYSILGRTCFPASGHIELCLAAAGAVLDAKKLTLSHFSIQRALPLDVLEPCALQVRVDPGCNNSYEVAVCKRNGSESTVVATATVAASRQERHLVDQIYSLKKRCTVAQDPTALYEEWCRHGLEIGPHFQVITNLQKGSLEAYAEIHLGEAISRSGYACHPALLDGCFQTCASILKERELDSDFVYLPVSVDRVVLHHPLGDRLIAYAYLIDGDDSPEFCRRVNLALFSPKSKEVCAELQGVAFHRMARHNLRYLLEEAEPVPNLFYEVAWRKNRQLTSSPQKAPDIVISPDAEPTWVILADQAGVGASVARNLQTSGKRVLVDALSNLFTSLENRNIAGVVHCLALDATSDKATNLEETQRIVCGSVLQLVQSLVAQKAGTRPKLWLLTQGAQVLPGQRQVEVMQSPLAGLSKVIATEHPELSLRLIDLDPEYGATEAGARVLEEFRLDDGEEQVAWRQDCRYVARIARQTRELCTTLQLPSLSYELVAVKQTPSLQLQDKERSNCRRRGQIEVAICATGVTLSDVRTAAERKLSAQDAIGSEFAGIVTAVSDDVDLRIGDAVYGIGSGAFTDRLITSSDSVVRKPERLSFEEAAGLPAAFVTAYACLCDFSRLQAGGAVLIHADSAGIGLIAIQIAMKLGATVFATARSAIDRAYLQRIGVAHVFDRQSTDFVNDITELTSGAGLDMVLNTLAGSFIPATLNIVKDGGSFVELNQNGSLTEDEVAQAYPFVRYKVFSLKELIGQSSQNVRTYLESLNSWYEHDQFAPPPVQCFPIQQAPEVFHSIEQSGRLGKAVLASNNSTTCRRFCADRTYLVTGALGGLGLELCEWLIDHGARSIAALSRRAPSEFARKRMQTWRTRGVTINTYATDVGDHDALARTLDAIRCEQHPMAGVFHLAGTLSDATLNLSEAMLAKQDWQYFQQVFQAKVYGSWFLHQLTLKDELEYFVLYSSASASAGSIGLSDYAAANSFMDALAHHRRNQGLPGLSINWGIWSGIGMATKMGSKFSPSMNEMAFSPNEGFKALSMFLRDPDAINVGFATEATFSQQWGADRLLFSELNAESKQRRSDENRSQSSIAAFAARLEKTWTSEQTSTFLCQYIEEQVREVFRWPSERSFHQRDNLFELGMDSLMAVELSNRLNRDLGRQATLAAPAIYGHPTIEALGQYLARELKALSVRGRH